MSAEWDAVYGQVCEILAEAGYNARFFRGHSNAAWKLLPGVSRLPEEERQYLEHAMFVNFINRAGSLVSDKTGSWNNAFTMQHHGIPIRLLDWTETFAIALFFAIREGDGDAAVWVLHPYALNEKTRNDRNILDVEEFPKAYYSYFIDRSAEFDGDVVAIYPPADHIRIFRQRGAFTVHRDIITPLEELHPEVLTKLIIPAAARADAQRFLESAGITEFSLFPDLDGLVRELRRRYRC